MPTTIKVRLPDGTLKETGAESVEVEKSSENWSEYRLADGTTIKVKPVVSKVMRTLEEYDNEGNPIYQIIVTPVISVESPESLKKSGK